MTVATLSPKPRNPTTQYQNVILHVRERVHVAARMTRLGAGHIHNVLQANLPGGHVRQIVVNEVGAESML